MKVIRKRPGGRLEPIEIRDELEALQDEVGGHIEAVTMGNDWCVLCDEEWRFKEKATNCFVNGVEFGGTILFVGIAGENFCDIPREVEEMLRERRTT